eukprot:scaffold317540_cov37-Tisochrysis_lutea.AAC.1
MGRVGRGVGGHGRLDWSGWKGYGGGEAELQSGHKYRGKLGQLRAVRARRVANPPKPSCLATSRAGASASSWSWSSSAAGTPSTWSTLSWRTCRCSHDRTSHTLLASRHTMRWPRGWVGLRRT